MFFTKIKEVKVTDEKRVNELKTEIEQLHKDYKSEKRIYENEFKIKLNEATEDKKNEIARVTQENAVLKEKVNILEKAFENMGFDVKDMKEILNKLVDGIVSKNSINVIK